ncbi:response regulator [Aliifodinibius sp. S!AR15-10]|uniref:response regulator n=1 Tax=Aliifodinibius sp. S!AR15-10 TaxID=2950437 RepID=UPI002856F490|nr:response regulator [Aliifodinibius sp. S!AR15-10]MDR8390871.1 response regulator [Aliifodinibius sp. S!AR15-10]
MEKNILIVEDEMIIALMLDQMVTKQGHNVIDKVSTGEAAVESAQRHKPDLILMDIRLGGQLDGIQAMQKINEQNPTSVIFVTGNSDDSYKKRIKEIDHLAFLTKPVTFHELSRSLSAAS